MNIQTGLRAPPLRVLLVDDEAAVLQFAASRLESLGYDVTAATSGEQALFLLSIDDNFDLLFTDVMLLGGVSGVELIRRARRACGPSLGVLLTSVDPLDVFDDNGKPDGSIPVLLKPYELGELKRALHQVLGTAALIH